MFKPWVKYSLKRQLKKSERRPSIVHGNLINKVAVVSNKSFVNFEQASAYVKELRDRGIKTVDFYIGFPNQKAQDLYSPTLKDFPFNKKSFNFLGAYNTPELENSNEVEYDVLIDLTDGKSLECDLVVARTKAKWKAGKREKGREALLDFMIDVGQGDYRNLIHHLNLYLTGFNNLNAA